MTDDLLDADDPLFQIKSNDRLLNTVRLFVRTFHGVLQLFLPLIYIERFFLFIVKPLTWLVRGYLPYAYHLIRTTVQVGVRAGIPIGLGYLGILELQATVNLPAGLSSVLQVTESTLTFLATHTLESPLYLAVALTIYYSIFGLIPYQPKDWHSCQWRTRKQPEPPFEWELTIFTLLAALPIVVLFAVTTYTPTVMTMIPYGALEFTGLLSSVALIGVFRGRRYFKRIWSGGTREQLNLETLLSGSSQNTVIGLGITLFAVSGLTSYLNITQQEAILSAYLVSMWWLSRRVRWLLYQDRDGFVDIRPPLTLITVLNRTPLAYALILVALGGPTLFQTAPYAVPLSFAPFTTLLGYYTFRYYRLNGQMYLQRPRSKIDPDDWNVEEYIRRYVLPHEAGQALRPKNQMWTSITRVCHTVRKANRELLSADKDHFEGTEISPILLAKLRDKDTSTYQKRREYISHIRTKLHQMSEKLEDYDGDDKANLEETVQEAGKALEEARRWNEENGKLTSEFLNKWIS